jgi:hypothetical protein
MRWIGLKLTRSASEFVDHDGNVLTNLPDLDDLPAAITGRAAGRCTTAFRQLERAG